MYNSSASKSQTHGSKSIQISEFGTRGMVFKPKTIAALKRIARRSLRQSKTLEVSQGLYELMENKMQLSSSWFGHANPYSRPQYYEAKLAHEADTLALAVLELDLEYEHYIKKLVWGY